MNPTKTCRWVMKGASIGSPAVYCDCPVSFKMPKDEDQNRKREYEHLCPQHLAEEFELTRGSSDPDWEFK